MAKRAVQIEGIKLRGVEGTVDVIKFLAARAGNPDILWNPNFFH
jgi:hypothetical protein